MSKIKLEGKLFLFSNSQDPEHIFASTHVFINGDMQISFH